MYKQAFLVFLLLVSSAARAGDAVPPDPLNFNYALYAGGLRVVDVSVSYTLRPDLYDIYAVARTRGLWASLVPWRNVIKAYGKVDAGRHLHPEGARYDDVWRERARTTSFSFGKDGVASAVASPPHKKDGRVEATPEQRRGAIDPLSAVVSVLVRGGERGCAGKIPAFDGRRVYNLVLTSKGSETLPRNRYGLYSGPAVRCEVMFEPVAGFPPPGKKSAGFWSAQDNSDKRNPLIIWIARPLPGLPELPVRVQSTVELGTLVAHLQTVETSPVRAAVR